jgi:hypothetical protein
MPSARKDCARCGETRIDAVSTETIRGQGPDEKLVAAKRGLTPSARKDYGPRPRRSAGCGETPIDAIGAEKLNTLNLFDK